MNEQEKSGIPEMPEDKPEGSCSTPETVEVPSVEAVPEEKADRGTVPTDGESLPQEAPAEPEPVNAASQEPEKMVPGATPGKIAMGVALVVVLLAALIALVVSGRSTGKPTETQPEQTVSTAPTQTGETENTEPVETVPATVPEDGDPDDATCKGTYTASDDEVIAARDTVVATSGDRELTLGQLQVYYWMEVRQFLNNYGYYLAYFGLDYTQGLDTQVCSIAEEPMTWQQYFLEKALLSWHSYTAMAAEAEKNGVEMAEESRTELDSLVESMNENAMAAGFASGEELIQGTLGSAATMEDYGKFLEEYYSGLAYYTQITEAMTADDGEVEAYFDENAETYQENGITKDTVTVDVRHILIFPEGATSETIRTETFPEEAWSASEEKAKQILSSWEAGEKTEDSFAALAEEHSEDEGSNGSGGLYEDVSQGQMVEAFDDWCFDASRQPGDYGIVKTEFGYHIMYFRGSTPVWQETARNDLMNEKINDFVEDTAEQYPLTVEYSKILLAYVSLG